MVPAPKRSALFMLLTWAPALLSFPVFSGQLEEAWLWLHLVKDYEFLDGFIPSSHPRVSIDDACLNSARRFKMLMDYQPSENSHHQAFTYQHNRVYFPRFEAGTHVRVSFPPGTETSASQIIASILEDTKSDLVRAGLNQDIWQWALEHNVEIRFIHGKHEQQTLTGADSEYIVSVNLHTTIHLDKWGSSRKTPQTIMDCAKPLLLLSELKSIIRSGLTSLVLRYRLEEWINGESVPHIKARIPQALSELRALGLLSRKISDDEEHELQQLVTSMVLTIRLTTIQTGAAPLVYTAGDLNLLIRWSRQSIDTLALNAPEFMAIYQSLEGTVSPIYRTVYSSTRSSPGSGNP
ncbi:MAG: hypothetical protein ACR2PT_00205 [Endozoicomonas sp.]